MRKVSIIFLLITVSMCFIVCKNKSLNTSKIDNTVQNESANITKDSIWNNLVGIWKISGDENSIFQIFDDSIYYTDQGQMFKYQIKMDSILIFYDDWIYRCKYLVLENKLIFEDENGISSFERFQE